MLRATLLGATKYARILGQVRFCSIRQSSTLSPLFPEGFRPSKSKSGFQNSFVDVSPNRVGYFNEKKWHLALKDEVDAYPGLSSLLSDHSVSISTINSVSYMDQRSLGIPRSLLGQKEIKDADDDTSMNIDKEIHASSVVKKRRLKMNKHKHRKRRKRDRRRTK